MGVHWTSNVILGVLIKKGFQLIKLELVVNYLEKDINIIKEFLWSNGNARLHKWKESHAMLKIEQHKCSKLKSNLIWEFIELVMWF